jgi:hypothetical protein
VEETVLGEGRPFGRGHLKRRRNRQQRSQLADVCNQHHTSFI